MRASARFWWRALATTLAAAAILLGSVLGWLKWHEAELVFHTAASRQHPDGHIPAFAHKLSIRTADGAQLAALILPAPSEHDSGFWVLHLHGNADSAFSASQLKHAQGLRDLGLNVLVVDYRGFGLSPGTATERHVEEDAEAAYQELIHRQVPAQKIIIWGHSLGSGPAVYLAAMHPVAALVLFGAFTSVPDAAQDIYRHLPVKWLTGIQFDSLARIGHVHAPVLIAHSRGDAVIPFHHALQLFAAANEPKRLLPMSAPYSDDLGGHVNALYDHLEVLAAALTQLTGVRLVAPALTGSASHARPRAS
jgi:pimeloyl-ACP methyl ester carboxylesterase